MSNSNAVAPQAQRPTFSAMISTSGYQKLINNTLKDPKKAQRFVASITSAVATNPSLQECDPATILSGALLGESLGLSPSPQLGQFYLVPYENRKKGCKDAQFQLGYKGYVQLALRSGYYKSLNVMSVRAGELNRWNPLTEEIDLELIEDENVREAAPVIGYVAMFEYLNGFRKTIYWSREKMINHADKYSQAFSKGPTTGRYPKVSFEDYCNGNFPSGDAWKYSSYWYKDFDGMAYKTMLRQLISKWGIMSIELQTAFEQDAITENVEQDAGYVETPPEIVPAEAAQELPATTEESSETEQVNLDDL